MNSKIRTSEKLKIPPAFEPDVWICNHSGKKEAQAIQNCHDEKLSGKKNRFLSMKDFDKQMNRKFEQIRLARRKILESPYNKSLLLSEYNNLKHLVPKKRKFRRKKKCAKLIMFCERISKNKKKFKLIKKSASNAQVKRKQFVRTEKKIERKKNLFFKLIKKKSNGKNLKKLQHGSDVLNDSLLGEDNFSNSSSIIIPTLNQENLQLSINKEKSKKYKALKSETNEIKSGSLRRKSKNQLFFSDSTQILSKKDRMISKQIDSNTQKTENSKVFTGLSSVKLKQTSHSNFGSKTKIENKNKRHSIGSPSDFKNAQVFSSIVKSVNYSSKYNLDEIKLLHKKMRSKSDSCLLGNKKLNFVTQNQRQSNSFFNDVESNWNKNSYWIESGKTQLGLKIERFVRRYKKLSKQKKYLLFFIIVLLFFTTLSFLIIFVLLLLGPTSQYFIINNLESNGSQKISTQLMTQSPSKITLTSKKTGLVGDICLKVIGDCSKYMECKKHDRLHSNFSTCQCISGYIVDSDRTCKGLAKSYCEYESECWKDLLCNKHENKCSCKNGYMPRFDGTCFGLYNSPCQTDDDCLKNGECTIVNSTEKKKVCRCNSKQRTFYMPKYEPFRQCKLLVGARCNDDQDCVDNARCNKYCSCKEVDLFFETENYFCEDACQLIIANKHSKTIKHPHPRKCGYYYSCSPRDLDLCPSNYSFDFKKQSCNSSVLCH